MIELECDTTITVCDHNDGNVTVLAAIGIAVPIKKLSGTYPRTLTPDSRQALCASSSYNVQIHIKAAFVGFESIERIDSLVRQRCTVVISSRIIILRASFFQRPVLSAVVTEHRYYVTTAVRTIWARCHDDR